MADDAFPAETTMVLLAVPGDFDGLRRLFVYGTAEGLMEKIDAHDGRPFRVERVGSGGRRTTLWLNPGAVAYYMAGPPLGELGTSGEAEP